MEKKTMSSLTAALILLLINIAFTCIVAFGKLYANSALTWLSYIIVVAAIAYFVVKYGKDKDDNVTFGNLFGYGFKITAFLILFYCLFMVILYTIFPEFKEQVVEIMKTKAMEGKSGQDAAEIQKGLDMMIKMFWVWMIGGILFIFGLCGGIGALIGAGIAKKNPRVYHEDSL